MPSRALGARIIVWLAVAACHRAKLPDGDLTAAIASAKPISGHAYDPASLHGKPALVLFVSPTCRYCLATLPRAAAAATAHGAGLVAVFTAGDADRARRVLDQLHIAGAGLMDDGTLVRRYGIDGVPVTFVVGADGAAREMYEGEQSEETLDDALAP
jgi:hypothetical protein